MASPPVFGGIHRGGTRHVSRTERERALVVGGSLAGPRLQLQQWRVGGDPRRRLRPQGTRLYAQRCNPKFAADAKNLLIAYRKKGGSYD
ncbi:hypothetical protein BHE74_00059394 [Ensete ventricosum]|nr:hypothetical protein BHE74_00059394 [Ensete ventricosum]